MWCQKSTISSKNFIFLLRNATKALFHRLHLIFHFTKCHKDTLSSTALNFPFCNDYFLRYFTKPLISSIPLNFSFHKMSVTLSFPFYKFPQKHYFIDSTTFPLLRISTKVLFHRLRWIFICHKLPRKHYTSSTQPTCSCLWGHPSLTDIIFQKKLRNIWLYIKAFDTTFLCKYY